MKKKLHPANTYRWDGGREEHPAQCVNCGTKFLTMTTMPAFYSCSLVCRLELQVNKKEEDECWNWTGVFDTDGYGEFMFNKIHWRAHRASYFINKGSIPKGMVVMHSCDNTKCCNPRHLSIGTNLDNTLDKIRKGRSNPPKGERSGSAKLTDDAVRFIRKSPHLSVHVLAQQFGVHIQCIYKVRQGIRWSHVKL